MHWKAFLTSSNKQIFALSGETQHTRVTSTSAPSASDNTNPCPLPWWVSMALTVSRETAKNLAFMRENWKKKKTTK